jgi:alcohol dehydrogenase class IV
LPADFTWRDGERTIRFGDGVAAEARELLAGAGFDRFVLLTTERAAASVPALGDAAERVIHVPPGRVDEVSAGLIEDIGDAFLAALGGGRVIDTAKAIAAVRGARVCAVPTTLSGAPMTAVHRFPEGHTADHLVRPALVLSDPDAMTTLPERALRATAMNALAHGAESLYTPMANPVAEMAALRGAASIAGALDQDRAERDRSALGLGAILCAYAIDSTGFAIQHILCQTVVRVCGTPHAETYAAILPRAMEAMRHRAPAAIASLALALGTDPEAIGKRIEALAGGRVRLGELGADHGLLERVVEAAAQRPDLAQTPDPPSAAELAAILESAW